MLRLAPLRPALLACTAVALSGAPAFAHAGAGAQKPACCSPGAGADKPACCAPGASCCAPGASCCAPEGAGKPRHGGHSQGENGHHPGHHGSRHERHRFHQAPFGMGSMHGMRGAPFHAPELRYMPGSALGNRYLVFAATRGLQADWYSLGLQGNYALQLNPAAGQGNWFAPYWGVLPQLGAEIGPVRLSAGSLLGLGGMLRTATVAGANNVLQFQGMWVLEPRAGLHYQADRWSAGLVATYAFTPNAADFGGPSVGLRFGFGGSRR